MNNNMKIGFLGAGNMAQSIISGLIENGFPRHQIQATVKTQASKNNVQSIYGINVFTDNTVMVERADIIFLAVKPHQLELVLREITPIINEKKPLLVSVAAGVLLKTLTDWTAGYQKIVRAMPNTPSAVGCGVTGIFASSTIALEYKEPLEYIFQSVGATIWLDNEDALHNITSISGSGPAYFLLFIEAMIDAAVAQGIPHKQAEQLAIETALGAATMAKKNVSTRSVKLLRQQITSPGGTTEQALNVMENADIRGIIKKAMTACLNHSYKMSKEF